VRRPRATEVGLGERGFKRVSQSGAGVTGRQRSRRATGVALGEIRAVPYDPGWPREFARIEKMLRSILPTARIEHIGSTSVPGCDAKPVIDVSVGLAPGTSLGVDAARSIRLEFRSVQPYSTVFGLYGKGRTRLANVHVRERGSQAELRDLQFRDFLRAHPKVVRDYVAVKQRVLSSGKVGRDYTEAKAPFIAGLDPRVRRWARRTSWSPGR
jgi:GrpB-like predicted nucleotidyltransferase (UPF0157 family)